jgi:DNA-binding transcriptional regulator LsrR (DeoR family)
VNVANVKKTMPRKPVIQSRETVVQAVALLRDAGHGLNEIGEILGISGSLASRLAREARESKWLISTEVAQLTPEQRAAATARILERDSLLGLADDLQLISGQQIAVHIVTGAGSTDAEETRRQFGRAAASHVREILKEVRGTFVGVAYGRLLRAALVEGLRAACGNDHPCSGNPLTVAALRGDVLMDEIPNSPSMLAYEMAHIANGAMDPAGRYWRSLAGVPPVVPQGLSEAAQNALRREFLPLLPDLVELFGLENESPAITMSTAFVSVGPVLAVSPYTQRLWALGGLESAKVTGLVGDLAGIPMLDPDRADAASELFVEQFERNTLLGVKSASLKGIIAAGGRVCALVAADADRVPALLTACRLQLINVLILDTKVARDLHRMVRMKRNV